MDKVKKALEKRKKFHKGSHTILNQTAVGVGETPVWSPHNPYSGDHRSEEVAPIGGSPEGSKVVKTSTPAGEGEGTLTETRIGGGAPTQEINLGETKTTTKAEVDKLGVTETDSQGMPLVSAKDFRKQGLTPDMDIQELKSWEDSGLAVAMADIEAPVATAHTGTASQGEKQQDYTTSTYDATRVGTLDKTQAASGKVSEDAVAGVKDPIELTERSEAAKRLKEAEEEALITEAKKVQEDDRSQVRAVRGATAQVDAVTEAVAQTRSMVHTDSAPEGEAAKIETMYTTQDSQRRQEAKRNLEREFRAKGLDDETVKRLSEDPATLARELDALEDDEIKTTLSGLPREALISTQMDNLLEGMEDGNIPKWAMPAVAAVESNLAKRGLSVSTVGRDNLFSAIIQSAIPLAQGNAQAIQAATSQDKTIAGQFLVKNAEFKQQMEIANLSNEQQMKLANLTARNQADKDDLDAAQQTELANLQTRLQVNLKSAEIASSMNQAQLAVDQQTAVTNAMTVAKIDLTNMSAEQQVQLANSKFMQTAALTDLSNRQQSAVQNATLMAQMDVTQADQNLKLAITNAQSFLKMDLTNLSNEQQALILDQQLRQQRLLTDASADNAAKQFNAASENQKNQFMTKLGQEMEIFNVQQMNAMEQFNAAEKNRIEAINANNALDAAKAEAALNAQIGQFNSQLESQREQWNASNAQAVEQSNIEWRRKANTIDTAAQNSANMLNAQQTHQLTAAEQAMIWQLLRDEASYNRTAYENDQQRRTSLYATALANETSAGKDSKNSVNSLFKLVEGVLGGDEQEEDGTT